MNAKRLLVDTSHTNRLLSAEELVKSFPTRRQGENRREILMEFPS